MEGDFRIVKSHSGFELKNHTRDFKDPGLSVPETKCKCDGKTGGPIP